jgi:hypothetical protein
MVKDLRISSFIYKEALPHIRLCTRSRLNFLIYEENLVFFFISELYPIKHATKNPVEMSSHALQIAELLKSHHPHPMNTRTFPNRNSSGRMTGQENNMARRG